MSNGEKRRRAREVAAQAQVSGERGFELALYVVEQTPGESAERLEAVVRTLAMRSFGGAL